MNVVQHAHGAFRAQGGVCVFSYNNEHLCEQKQTAKKLRGRGSVWDLVIYGDVTAGARREISDRAGHQKTGVDIEVTFHRMEFADEI